MSRRTLWTVAGGLLIALGAASLASTAARRYGANDFAHYYASSRLLLEGRDPYGVRLDRVPAGRGLRFDQDAAWTTDTPAFLELFEPLAALGPRRAYAAWTGVQAVSLAAVLLLAVGLALRTAPRAPRSPPEAAPAPDAPPGGGGLPTPPAWLLLPAVGLLLTSSAVRSSVYYAQLQLPLLALVLGGFALQERGRHGTALALVTAAGLVKLYPLALLPWFAARALRARGWSAFVPAALVALALVLPTADLWPRFAEAGASRVWGYVGGRPFNVAPAAVAADALAAVTGRVPGPATLRALWAGPGAAALLGAYLSIGTGRRGPKEDGPADGGSGGTARAALELSLLLCALLLAVPVLWGHYLVWLIPPALVLAVQAWRRPTAGRLAGLAAVYLLALDLVTQGFGRGVGRGGPAGIAAAALPLAAVVGLGAWLALGVRARRQSPADPRQGCSGSRTGRSV